MFARLINDAKSALSSLLFKYLARASVAVPFLIASGFALAAITLSLIERFGQVTAYWLIAGGMALIGIVFAIVVSVKEHEEEAAEHQAEQANTKDAIDETTALAIGQMPIALLSALVATPEGVATVLRIARLLRQNFSLVLLLAMIGALLWPTKDTGPSNEKLDIARKRNGSADHVLSASRH